MPKKKKNTSTEFPVIEKDNLSRELQNFVHRIDGLKTIYPDIRSLYTKRVKSSTKSFINFLEPRSKNLKGKRNIAQIKVEDYFHFNFLLERMRRETISIDTLSKAFIVSLVSQFDAFLGKLVRWIYLNKPEILNASEKMIPYNQIIEFKSFEEAKEYFIEKEVENILRESHITQISILEKLLSITLTKELDIWNEFIELTERRNLFVHNDGIVTSQYLNICKKFKVDLKDITIGKKLESDPEYFVKAYNILFEMAFKLSQVIRRKLKPDNLEEADENIINTGFNLLLKEDYSLVIKLLSFACNILKKYSDEKARVTMIVNLAIAYKWKGDKVSANRILDSEDWSICSSEYQMAHLTLKETYKDAAELMINLGATSKISKTDYLIWPLFKKFRKSQYFRKAFLKVFNQDYVTISRTEEHKNLTSLFK